MSGINVGQSNSNVKVKAINWHHDGSTITKIKQVNWGNPATGTNVTVWNNAVEWTYTGNLSGSTLISGSNSPGITAYGETQGTAGDKGYAYYTCTYNFKTPLIMKAGQTITTNISGYASRYLECSLYCGSLYYFQNQGIGTYVYTFSSDTSISSLTAKIYVSASAQTESYANMVCTLNSDYGNFILDSTGTSDQ